MTQTAEFEEAYRKLAEISTIEEKLKTTRQNIKKKQKRLTICITLSVILMLAFLAFCLYYYFKKPDISFELKQKEAERNLIEYNKHHLLQAKNEIQKHVDAIETYRANQNQNLEQMSKTLASPDNVDQTVTDLQRMVSNKNQFLKEAIYDTETLHLNMKELRTINRRMKDFKWMH